MKAIKLFAFLFIFVFLIFMGIGYRLSPSFLAQSQIQIKQNPEIVFPLIAQFENWSKWSPWNQTDSTMQIQVSTDSLGRPQMLWTSAIAQNGKQTIVFYDSLKSLEMELFFGEQGKASSKWTFSQTEEGTQVHWTFQNDVGNDLFGRYLNLVMEDMMAEFLQQGLFNLKAHLENPIP